MPVPILRLIGDRLKAIVSLPWTGQDLAFSQVGSPEAHAKAYTMAVWAYRCISIRANAMAGMPWDLLLPSEEPVGDVDPVRLLLEVVGDEMNWPDLLRATSSDLDIFGVGYWLKRRGRADGSGPVRALQRLNPITLKKVTSVTEGLLGWEQWINGLKINTFDREELVYFRHYNPMDDLGGLAPLQVALESVNASQEAKAYVTSFFRNYAIPPMILTSDQPLGDKAIETTKRWWDRLFKGVDNQHKVGITGSGLKPTVIGYPTKDLALAEITDSLRKDICAAFGVPPAIAGAWEAANYAASKEQRQSLYEDAIFPVADYMAGVIQAELVLEFPGSRKFVWLKHELPIMQTDKVQEAQYHDILVRAGIEDPDAAADALGVTPPTPEARAARQAAQQDQRFGSQEVEPTEDEPKAVTPFLADLGKWERKALKRVAKGRPAACPFDSEEIPAGVAGAISDALGVAETPDQIRAVFDQARGREPMPQDATKALLEALRAVVEALAASNRAPALTIKADKVEVTPEIRVEPTFLVPDQPAPEVHVQVDVPEQKPPEVKVHVDPAPVEVKVAPTPVQVRVPKLTTSTERQTVKRDRQGLITGSESETDYTYEEEA